MDKPAILGGVPVTKEPIPFTKIIMTNDEKKAVEDVIRSKIFVNGKYTKMLEKEFARYISVKHAIAVSNGTDALFLSYLALGIGFNDKVITTPLSFIATVSSIMHSGAIPIFADVKLDGNLDPDSVSQVQDDFSAITIVHLYGKPADMRDFLQIAHEHNAYIIEDAAHAHGAEYDGKKIGSFGDIAAFSLYPSKIIAAGGWGGIITTNNDEISEKLRLLRAHGELKVIKGAEFSYQYIRLGYNMRISEIEAAIAYHQLKKLDSFIKVRRSAAKKLTDLLENIPGITLPSEEPNKKHVYYIYCILIDPNITGWSRNKFVEALNAEGICARKGYHIPIHKTILMQYVSDPRKNHFARIVRYPNYSKTSLPTAELLANRMIWLPLYPGIKDTEIEKIAIAIKRLIKWRNRNI